MAATTRKNIQEPTPADGGDQTELQAQMTELQAEIETLRASRQDRPTKAADTKPRVPSSMPKFKGKRGEDVRQWLFQVETRCRYHGHDASDDNATLPAIAGTAMEDPAYGWFLFWAFRTPVEEQTCAQFTRDALANFEASNYQDVLHQKLRQLSQVDDIEDYNGKYSALIFRVENMSEVDQVSYYCEGLKRATQSYVKLQNALTPNEAMDQAVKYEMARFGGERKVSRKKLEREQRVRGKPRVNTIQDKKPFNKRLFKPALRACREEQGRTCVVLLQETWSFQARLQEAEGRSGKRLTTPVKEGPDVVRASEGDLTVNEATLNLLCEDPLVYNPLSRNKDRRLKERTIRVKLGDTKIGEALLELVKIEIKLKGVSNYQCVAVVFDIPDEFDCVLGMPFFVDVQPNVDWKRRCFKDDESSGASTADTSTPCGKCSQANGSGLHDAVDSESSSTRSLDSCRAAVLETQPECEVKTAERPAGEVNNLSRREKKNAQAEAMFTLAVVDSEGVETKYITRKN
ncbi:unnamed protein product [Phytophthora lilii]|uniref:Unnamed protein product n=1 Tax=Phytophthora lilii TaxID=2077276 RepID=A0A9W6TPK2_9STRA|nr:unnamed protein product [Phytophthora lilii]